MSLRALFTLSVFILPFIGIAQKSKGYKFEKVTAALLERKSYSLDSNAAAIVLADVGDTRIEGNNKGWFSFVFHRHRRVHILRQSAYDEATLQVPLYHNGYESEERLEGIKAVSYNLEGGKVTETKLSRDAIFKEKVSKNKDLYKLTMPAVREGTIIDIEYSIKSDYLFTLQPWDFQEEIPVLWSEYSLTVPQFFDYMMIYKGYIPFFITDRSDRSEQFNMVDQAGTGRTERFAFTSGVTDYRWATREVPAFVEEKYLSSRANYQAHLDFQLAGYRYPLQAKNLVPTWPEMTADLLKDENFGKKIDANNGWLNETMRSLNQGDPQQRARAIYSWVRDNITCTGQEGIYLQNQVKDVFRAAKGSVAEVNLLLVTMLRHAGLNANPVMLSTRENGTVYTAYPMLSRFNYIIASVDLGDRTVMLDASKPRLGFGRLLPECYNGIARTISPVATAHYLLADSLQEREVTMLFLAQNGKNLEGTYTQTPGYFQSYRLRKKVTEKGAETLFADLRKSIGQGTQLSGTRIDSLNNLDLPLSIKANIKMSVGDEDILYVDPMFGEGVKDNPFHSEERNYPVEMPYTFDQTFLLTMHVPEGYTIDELPKPVRLSINGKGEGAFDYLISVSEGVISMRSQIRIKRATFSQDDYYALREFFTMIVSKHQEKIVFRKKK